MIQELSDLALFMIHFLGDPLMREALLIVTFFATLTLIFLGFLRLSRKLIQVLKDQKEIKSLITQVLLGARSSVNDSPSPRVDDSKAEDSKALDSSEPLHVQNESVNQAEMASDDDTPSKTIVHTYRAGKSLYVLYSDGSVEADTDGYVQTFASIHLLKEAMARKNQNNHFQHTS
jgi:hypothetical protein